MATGVALESFWSLPVEFRFPVVNAGGGGRPSQPLSRSLITSWEFVLVSTFLCRDSAHLYRGLLHSILIPVVLKKLEAAVDNRGVCVCSKCGSCYLEQDGERVCLVVVQLVMRDEGLKDVIANRIFFHVSKIGTVCDEINLHVVRVIDPALTSAYDPQILVEELLKNPGTEAASKSDVVRGKDRVRFCIVDQTKNQVGEWVDENTVQRTRRSFVADRIEDQVVGDLGMGLCNPKPEAKIGERLFVVLVG